MVGFLFVSVVGYCGAVTRPFYLEPNRIVVSWWCNEEVGIISLFVCV